MCAPQAPGVGFNRMLTNICEDMIKEVFVEIKSINEKKRDRKEVHMDPPYRKSMREELRGKKQNEVAKAKNGFAWQDVFKGRDIRRKEEKL